MYRQDPGKIAPAIRPHGGEGGPPPYPGGLQTRPPVPTPMNPGQPSPYQGARPMPAPFTPQPQHINPYGHQPMTGGGAAPVVQGQPGIGQMQRPAPPRQGPEWSQGVWGQQGQTQGGGPDIAGLSQLFAGTANPSSGGTRYDGPMPNTGTVQPQPWQGGIQAIQPGGIRGGGESYGGPMPVTSSPYNSPFRGMPQGPGGKGGGFLGGQGGPMR